MGYPLKSFQDMLDNMSEIERLNPEFCSFILYKTSDEKFREYILRNFNRLHEQSGRAMFFVMDRPKEWLNRDDIEYYRRIQGNDYIPDLDDREIDIVCDHFMLSPSFLPAVLVFPNLRSRTIQCLGLKDLNIKRLDRFFDLLFEPIGTPADNQWGRKNTDSRVLWRKLNEIKQSIPEVYRISVDSQRNIGVQLDDLRRIVEAFREEHRQDMRDIFAKLNEIQSELAVFRQEMRSEIERLLLKPENEMRDGELERLYTTIDDRMVEYVDQLVTGVA